MVDAILDIVPHGSNLPGPLATVDQVVAVLSGLNDALKTHGYEWRDVSLVMMGNSKLTKSHKDQAESDQNVVTGLDQFCAEQGWFPSMMGASTFSMFFRDRDLVDADISDGILFVAFVSAALPRIPVAIEISRHSADRKYAARNALRKGVDLYCSAIADTSGLKLGRMQAFESSTVLLLSTGSGHVEAQEFIDFKECYAVGQELLDAAGEARIVGGCATNRSSAQLQCIYYSEDIGVKTHYRSVYNHAAVLCLLPFAKASYLLRHPYRRVENTEKLEIEFDEHDKYADGRYFYIRRINGRPPIEFLADYWDFTTEELLKMAANHTALPTEPKAHLVTIASSLSKYDRFIWPNVPIWLEEIDGEIMLRLVRAEADDSNYYLMYFRPEWLNLNARDLTEYYQSNFGGGAALMTFLCESRKYVLNWIDSNGEAEEIISAVPDESPVIGIYLNGEYSVGVRDSIGYHNYSQIGAVLTQRPVEELPPQVAGARRAEEVRVFVCHSSRDKALVKAIVDQLARDIRKVTIWMDEKKLITGDHLTTVIKEEIRSSPKPFLFLAFISRDTLQSAWVQRELGWAIQRESKTGDRFIFPVLLDDIRSELEAIWGQRVAKSIAERKFLVLRDYSDEGVQSAARQLSADVKAWVERTAAARTDKGQKFSTLDFNPPDDQEEEPDR